MPFLLDLSAAFAVALLCGLGVGGGGLFIVYLTLAVGFGQIEAQGINLIFFISAASASLFQHIKKRRLKIRFLLYLSLCGATGAIAGSLCTVIADPDFIRKIFGACLMFAGVLVLVQPHNQK
ncbi:MAG: TSUP family transporter [Eubacteriales bacterium]